MQRLLALIDERGLTDRVKLPRSALSDAEMKDTLVGADVFAILSQRYASEYEIVAPASMDEAYAVLTDLTSGRRPVAV